MLCLSRFFRAVLPKTVPTEHAACEGWLEHGATGSAGAFGPGQGVICLLGCGVAICGSEGFIIHGESLP